MAMNLEETVVTMIANAGDSKSSSLEAISYAKEGDHQKARECLESSEKALGIAHKAHRVLLALETREDISITVLIVHAMNHLSVAEATKYFADELVSLYESQTT